MAISSCGGCLVGQTDYRFVLSPARPEYAASLSLTDTTTQRREETHIKKKEKQIKTKEISKS